MVQRFEFISRILNRYLKLYYFLKVLVTIENNSVVEKKFKKKTDELFLQNIILQSSY